MAHFGTDKTYSLLKDRFFWPNMYGYVHNFVSQCSICQQTKCDSSPPKAPLTPMAIPEAPMQFIAIDIAFMPKDNHGFQYFLLIGDVSRNTLKQYHLKIRWLLLLPMPCCHIGSISMNLHFKCSVIKVLMSMAP